MGGFVAAAQPIVDLLRQRARPYLFSNSLAPPLVAGALKALEIAIQADERRTLLAEHARRFRAGLAGAGFRLAPGATPIVPVMLGDAKLAQDMAKALDERGIYVAGFFFPVVPKGAARIRAQLSAALTREDVDLAISAFADAGRALAII
jgi:glycine C-acetyltransferase